MDVFLTDPLRLLKALCMFGCLSTVVCGKILWFTMENETRPSLVSSPEKQSNPANTEDMMETFTLTYYYFTLLGKTQN